MCRQCLPYLKSCMRGVGWHDSHWAQLFALLAFKPGVLSKESVTLSHFLDKCGAVVANAEAIRSLDATVRCCVSGCCVLPSPLGAHLSGHQCVVRQLLAGLQHYQARVFYSLLDSVRPKTQLPLTHLVASHCVTPLFVPLQNSHCDRITAGTRGVPDPEGPHRAAALGLAAQLHLPQL